jgi:hypothetical protein
MASKAKWQDKARGCDSALEQKGLVAMPQGNRPRLGSNC